MQGRGFPSPKFHPKIMNNEINNFIEVLAIVKSPGNFFNQYSYDASVNSIEIVVAVGNTASSSLNTMRIACHKVRYPSYGGKAKFTTGIKAVMDTMKENWGGFLIEKR